MKHRTCKDKGTTEKLVGLKQGTIIIIIANTFIVLTIVCQARFFACSNSCILERWAAFRSWYALSVRLRNVDTF